MTATLPPWLSRVAALALLAALCLLFVSAVAAPVLGAWSTRLSALESSSASVERFRAALALRRSAAMADRRPGRDPQTALPLLLAGDTRDEALGTLQDLVNQRVLDAGGKPRLFAPVIASDPAVADIGIVALDVEFAVSAGTLRDLLYALEADLPRLELRRIEIAVSGAAPEDEMLTLSARIAGYWSQQGI